MNRVHDRDQLVAQLARELPDRSTYDVTDLARKLLRAGTTLHRLAEAQCNGDWPYDNGDRKVFECLACGSFCVRSQLKRSKSPILDKPELYADLPKGYRPTFCPECRLQARITELLAEYGLKPIFDGDPRGPVFKVIPPSYAERNANRPQHDQEGIYVS